MTSHPKSHSVVPGFAAEMVAQLPRFARMADPDAITLRMADMLACAIGAETLAQSADNAVARVVRFSKQYAGAAEATVWATGEKQAVDSAAFRNAVSARYLDYNDTYVGKAIVHPSDMIPAIVALAESRGVPWPRLIEAIGVAYETLCRAAEQATLGSRGWDASSLTPLATTAGCAWLVGLDQRQAGNALKLAALDSATLRCIRQGPLSDWKAAASGRGAVKALFAVRMAELGIEAPAAAFEGNDGFFERVSGPLSFESDDRPRLPDTVLKLYPSQIFTQAMIDAASEIAERIGVGGPGFASITIRTFDRAVEIVGGHGKTGDHALNRETADHSAAFCVAAMLTRRRLGYREFGTFLHDEDVLALMSRVHVADIGQAADAYPREQPCALDVELTDGRRLSARRSGPPVMDTASLQAKLDDLWPASSARNWPWTCPGTAPAFPDAPVRFAGPTSAKAGGH